MPTASGYAQVSIEMINAALIRPAYITFGVDPVDTDPQLICSSIAGSMNGATSLQGLLDTNVTIRRIRVSLGIDGAEDLQGDLAISLAGLTAQSSVAANTALLVHKRTARGGRRGRGRLYIPWSLSTAVVDEAGVITPAAVTAAQSKMTTWLAALNANTVPMVLLHEAGLTATGPPNPVTTLLVDTRIGTQRRRLGR